MPKSAPCHPRNALVRAVAVLFVGSLIGCVATPNDPAPLYERLGGAPGVTRIVERTIERSASDPRTKRSFDGIKLKAVKDSLVQQICHLGGGGCRYEGATMAEAHKDARIQASDFDAMVTILREELDAAGVDAGAKNQLLRLLAPMKREVLAAPNPAASAAAR